MQITKTYMLYYLLMYLILISWHDASATPPETLRILYMLALLGPLTLRMPHMLAIVIPAFYSVSNYSCFVSYLPNQVIFYLIFPIFALLLQKKSNNFKSMTLKSMLILFVLTGILNIIYSGTVVTITSSCLLCVLWFKLVPQNYNSYTHAFSYAFAMMSLTLSLIFVVNGSAFQMDYGYDGFERTIWTDPNYFGCVVGIGIVASMIEFFYNRSITIWGKLFFVATTGLSFYVLLLNGSRGALLAAVTSFLFLLIFNGLSIHKKLFIVCGFSLFFFLLYESGIFELLLYRMEEDSGNGGSGRLGIWQRKLTAYSSQLSVLEQIVGIGRDKGMRLGFGFQRGFHNDFLAMLVEYGIVGLVAFLIMMLSPLRKSANKVLVLSIIIYISMASLTLEPIAGGMMICFAFLFYACMIGRCLNFTDTNLFSKI